MLREYTEVAQTRGVAGRRRWFSDDDMDLIVWYSENGSAHGFQLCYDRAGRERAFTWDEKHGMSHALIDGGEQTPLRNDTPILVPGGVPELERVAEAFKANARDLEPEIVELVTSRLAEFRPPGSGTKTRS
jgi:hypothetical protein